MRSVNQKKGARVMSKYVMVGSKLNDTPTGDIFGYLMAVSGITKSSSVSEDIDAVKQLFVLRDRSDVYKEYIDVMLMNILNSNMIDDYMEHLTFNKNEFITSDGEVLEVNDMSDII